MSDDVAPTSLNEGRGTVRGCGRSLSRVAREAPSVNGWGGAVRCGGGASSAKPW